MATVTLKKTNGINTVSFANAPQANSDNYSFTEQQLIDSGLLRYEGSSAIVTLDVMSNDLGGAAKTLYSIDDGAGTFMQDLLASNITTGWEPTASGNLMRIRDGKIELDVTHALSTQGGTINGLAAGVTIEDSFTYAIRLSNGALSWAKVTFKVIGENDVPTVCGELDITAAEDSPIDTVDLLTGAHDADFGAVLSVTDVQGLEPGLSVNGATLTVDPGHAAFQSLAQGENKVITVSYNVTDEHGASVSQTATITITGTNDAPVVASVDVTGDVTEAVTPGAPLTDSGTITFTDVDLTDGHSVGPVVASAGALGTLTAEVSTDTTGTGEGGVVTWHYSVDAALVEHLAAGQPKTESFTFSISDGHGGSIERTVSVNIVGTNDAATITGDASGSVGEDAATTDGGFLSVADVDTGEAKFQTPFSLAGTYGDFSFNANTGEWAYALRNGDANVQALGGTAAEQDSLTVTSLDGTDTETITVNIAGKNDAPTIAATDAAFDVAETLAETDAALSTSGRVVFSDVDSGDTPSATHTASALTATGITLTTEQADAIKAGFAITDAATGAWSYNLASPDYLAAGDSVTATFTVTVTDDAGASVAQDVTLTIQGANDAAVIAGVDVRAVKEDTAVSSAGYLTTDGMLTVSDADHDQSSFTAVASVAGSNGWGTFTLDANGHWTYAADNSASAVQLLNDGQSLTDAFTAWSSDGLSSKVVTVTINGSTEPPATPSASAVGETIIVSSGTVNIDSQWIFGNDTAGTGSIVGFAANPTGFSTSAGIVTINTGSLTGGTALNVGGQAYTAYSINYQVIDSAGATANATLHLAVVATSSSSDTINLSTATLADPFFGGNYDYAYLNVANGDDTVNATTGDGVDVLIGGAGNDTFFSGAGTDKLTGDAGNDTFVFNTPLGTVDTLTDFNASENTNNQDWMVLSSSVFAGIGATGGILNAGDFASLANASGTYGSGVNVVFDRTTGNLWYDADGGNLNTGATLFAQVTMTASSTTDLDASDFKVIA